MHLISHSHSSTLASLSSFNHKEQKPNDSLEIFTEMQLQQKTENSEFALSFSCYSSNSSITSTAIAKVIREEQAARFHETRDVGDVNFDFSFVLTDEEAVPVKLEIDSRGWMPFLVKDDVDREIKATDDVIEASSAITVSLRKLFVHEREESSSSSSSCSSSEADELESVPSATYCAWSAKADPVITTPKWKKSRSTGSGSGLKRWRSLRHLLRRSNSEGKEAVVVVSTPEKVVDCAKVKRSSGEVLKMGSHERFYVERRAESEIGKRRSYLPYRKDLVGLFANVNGMGKMLLPF